MRIKVPLEKVFSLVCCLVKECSIYLHCNELQMRPHSVIGGKAYSLPSSLC
jgi:hypothetical protein